MRKCELFQQFISDRRWLGLHLARPIKQSNRRSKRQCLDYCNKVFKKWADIPDTNCDSEGLPPKKEAWFVVYMVEGGGFVCDAKALGPIRLEKIIDGRLTDR